MGNSVGFQVLFETRSERKMEKVIGKETLRTCGDAVETVDANPFFPLIGDRAGHLAGNRV